MPPNKSPEPTAVGACRSAIAVHVASRRRLRLFLLGHIARTSQKQQIMNEPQNAPTISFSLTYRNLRTLFIAGFAYQAVEFFIPTFKAVGGDKSFSTLDLIRLIFQMGHYGMGIYCVLIFCAAVAFAVLGFKYPQRWVFIAGSSFMVFMLILDFFQGSNPNLQEIFLTKLLGYIASAMSLTGFWIKPPIVTPPSAEIPKV